MLFLHDSVLVSSSVSIDINLGTICLVVGLGSLCGAIVMGLTTNFGKAGAIVGVLCLSIWQGMGNVSTPQPIPTPTPDNPFGPYPPTPAVGFEDQVIQAMKQGGATKEDLNVLAGLFYQISQSLRFDIQQPKPMFQNSNQFGNNFARLQQYRLLQNNTTSLGSKFPNFEIVVSGEMGKLGLKEGAWDKTKAETAANLMESISNVLRTM